jgi:IS5 family transposase
MPRDRRSFMRFLGRALEDRVPDAQTIWLVREQLTRAGAVGRRLQRYLATGGPIVDATVIQARRPQADQGREGDGQGRRGA